MKPNDDVFFFTLIDFLIQVFFFGLLLYVVGQAALALDKKRSLQKDASMAIQEQKLKESGFSSLTELLDYLTKLAPANELKGVADFFSNAGGYRKVKDAVETVEKAGGTKEILAAAALVKAAGGPAKVKEGAEMLRKAGLGKPSCNSFDDGRPKPVAQVIATDRTIRFEGKTPELEQALEKVGLSYAAVEELSLSDFSKTFAPLTARMPECRYTLRFMERTSLVHARDAARFIFYLQISR